MDKLFGLVEAFYSRFILRDLLGKIAPGAIILISFFINADMLFINELDLSFLLGMLIMAFCWILGFAVQGIGDRFKLIKYHVDDDASDRYMACLLLLENDKNNIDKDVERMVVIKETCGNAYVSMLIVLIISIIRCIIEKKYDLGYLLIISPNIILYISILASLRYMHFQHLERLDKVVSKILASKKEQG